MIRHTLVRLVSFGAILWLMAGVVRAQPTQADPFRSYLVSVEGYRQAPYRDQNHWAVGVGHNLSSHKQPVRTYSRAQIDSFYQDDLAITLRAARGGVRDFDTLPLSARQVVVGLIWTTGPAGFRGFTRFRQALSTRDYHDAARELRASKWWTQVGQARARRAYEALMRL
jgi:lysozyme